jgi:uncharacterized membrane protein
MTPRARWLILGFALAGLGFAGASAWVHYRLLTDPTYVSPCDISSAFNCTQAYLSRYGAVQGVPVAVGGLIWFALVALVAGFGRAHGDPSDPTGSYLFALATIGLAVVLYLGYASFFVLKTWCLLCLGTYAAVIGVFAVSGLTASVAMTRLPARLLSDVKCLAARPVTLVTAILYLAGAASAIAFFPKEPVTAAPAAQAAPPADAEKAFADAWFKQPRADLGIPADGAAVVVVKFNDYLCPSCKFSHLEYEPVFAKYKQSHPGAVRLVVKDWPWNTRCNFHAAGTIPGHEAACEAAAAVRMAAARGKADELIAWLFADQDKLIEMGRRGTGPDAVKAKAAEMLGVQDFDREYSAKLEEIRRDVADGGALQVQSTPTFFVNGIRAVANGTFLPRAYFDLAIKLELERAGK